MWPVTRCAGAAVCAGRDALALVLLALFTCASLVCATVVCATVAVAVDLRDGQIVGPETAAGVRELLPPEIWEHYAKGEYSNAYLDLRRPGLLSPLHPPPFLAATAANRGVYDLSNEGGLVRVDGQDAGFITGFPFPNIDPKEPRAAQKIVWDYFYNWWYNGNGHFYNEILWVNRDGVERSITTDVKFLYYQSAPEARDFPNPQHLTGRLKADVVEPADLQGTVSLTWRFRDPAVRDQNWVYVPALRRVRSVSPSNRSDGFLGSDLAQDDGQYFDGKPEDFEWKLVGEGEQLGLVDEASFKGDVDLKPVPGGGWRIVWADQPMVGYQRPGWEGARWAPVASVLIKRPVWVVEAVPKDRYYLFGKLLLRFDKETFKGYWSSKYDWQGNLLMSYQVQDGAFQTPDDGKHWMSGGRTNYQNAENMRLQRSTVVHFTGGQDTPSDYKVPLQPEDLEPDSLVRAGK